MRFLRSSKPASHQARVAVVTPGQLEATTGEELDFSAFYKRVHAPAIDYATRIIGYDAACDVVQDASLELFKRWPDFRPEQRTAGLFIGAVQKRIIDYQRREGRLVELTEELEQSPEFTDRVTSASSETGEIDLRPIKELIVGAMPLRCREVYLLVWEHGFSYQTAADALGITLSTAQKHMTRARAFMKKAFEQSGISVTAGSIQKLLPPLSAESNDD